MKNGYDRFFRQAQQAKGLIDRKEPKFRLKKQSGPETPEERLRQELARRIRANKRAALERKKLPIYPMMVSAIAFVVCGLGYHFADQIEIPFEKIEIGFFGSARAADESPVAGKTNAAAKPANSSQSGQEETANSAESKAASSAKPSESTRQWTQEEISHFTKLNERKRELDLREAELAKLEEELQRRKEELDEKIKKLEAMRAEISKALESRVAEDQAKVNKLVEVYSGMKPAQAARVIETLNEDLAVEILDKMKKKSAAEILDMMDAKKARRLSELMTGYRRKTASEAEPEKQQEAPAPTEE